MVDVAQRENASADRRDERAAGRRRRATASSKPTREPAGERDRPDHADRREAEARDVAVDARGRRPLRAVAAHLPPSAHDAGRAPAARSSSPTASRGCSQEERVLAYEFDGRRYDCGSKLGYLEATVDYGLQARAKSATAFGAQVVPGRNRGRTPRRSMTLNELRYIVAVAQERSFGRAAAKCFVSQPALSVAIQKLEEELGAPLFERGKSGSHDHAGRRADRRAGAEGAGGGGANPRDRDGGRNQLAGTLRLGIISHGGAVPAARPDPRRCTRSRRRCRSTSRRTLTENLEAGLRTGRVDAAIIALPFEPPGVVDRVPVRGAVPGRRAAGHKWAKRKSVAPDELAAEHTILLNVGHCFRDQVLDACPELNQSRRSR